MKTQRRNFIVSVFGIAVSLFVGAFAATKTFFSFKEKKPKPKLPDGVSVVFFHRAAGCKACRTLGAKLDVFFVEPLDAGNLPTLCDVKFDIPENLPLSEQFGIRSLTLLLVEQREEEIIRSRNITDTVWDVIDDASGFQDVLKKEISEFV